MVVGGSILALDADAAAWITVIDGIQPLGATDIAA
jgi:hypothetical protein